MMNDHDPHADVQREFLRHYNAIQAFVLSLVPDFAAAEDVLQETFLATVKKADVYKKDTNFLAWACTIARFEILRSQRSFTRRMLTPEVIAALTAKVPAHVLDIDRLEALRRCLRRLQPRKAKLVRLRYELGRQPAEIAQMVGQTVNSVSVGLSKAREALRECVQRQLRQQDAT